MRTYPSNSPEAAARIVALGTLLDEVSDPALRATTTPHRGPGHD